MANTAKVFQSGNSQAVRLPKEFRFAGREVEIYRRGDEVILREKRRSLAEAFDCLAILPDDMIEAIEHMDDLPPEEREGL
jgi:antitoxin VapB